MTGSNQPLNPLLCMAYDDPLEMAVAACQKYFASQEAEITEFIFTWEARRLWASMPNYYKFILHLDEYTRRVVTRRGDT